jgi:ABC-2 type transport system ATP-binding protein
MWSASGASGLPGDAIPGREPAIVCRGLTKRYGSIVALQDLNLEVPAGSIFGLLGPNGAGKTTTLRLLTGLGRPSGGTGRVAGVEIGGTSPRLQARIGYLDQDPRFYGWMYGRELLELAGRLHGLSGIALSTRVDEVLELVGLHGVANRRIGGYSGGMSQRLGIGQALINRPAVLILDEPVSSLDPEGRRDVMELIESLRGHATVLLSTHVLSDVERVCDHVAILDQGRLLIEAPIERLLADHARPIYRLQAERDQAPALDVLVRRLTAASWASRVDRRGDEVRVAISDQATAEREILPMVVALGVTLAAFERLRPSLEDVFLQLVRPEATTGPGGAPAADASAHSAADSPAADSASADSASAAAQ